MNYSSFTDFVNKLTDTDYGKEDTMRTVNPKIRYVPVDKFNYMSGANRPTEDDTNQKQTQKTGKPVSYSLQDPATAGQISAAKTPDQVPVRKAATAVPADAEATFSLELSATNILNGFIMSEVFGKPKCMRMLRRSGGR